METVNKELTLEERQANIDRLINRLRESKEESRRETELRVKTPEYQAMLKELRKKNAARGIIAPKL